MHKQDINCREIEGVLSRGPDLGVCEAHWVVQMIEVPDDKAPENMCPAEEQHLMRLVLVEQVNCMMRINRGEPYHK
jgi:hypothetical protein